MIDDVAPAICGYCKQHRWCEACGVGHAAGGTCGKCGGEIGPAPAPQKFPPLFVGQVETTEVMHDKCAHGSRVLRGYHAFLSLIGGTALKPYDAMLRRVVEKGFTGWLDIRITDDDAPKLCQARVQVALRGRDEPPRRGWSSVWVSPDFVRLLVAGGVVDPAGKQPLVP